MGGNSNGLVSAPPISPSLQDRIAHYRAQLEQAKANVYGLQGALQALEELERDQEAPTGVAPVAQPAQEPVE